MPHSVVIVQRKDAGYVKGAKVSLYYSGLLSGGFTKGVYTDSNGEAVIEHSGKGRADVYINGRNVDSMDTPGKKFVYI